MPRREIKLPGNIIPRDYQLTFLEHSKDMIRSNPDIWHLYSSPTGSGKSLMEWMLLQEIPDLIMITPRLEIIAGMLDKIGHFVDDWTTDELVQTASTYGIYTPVRLRNSLAKGTLDFNPSGLIIDEAHHDLADTYQDITMYLNGVPKIGLTATPYRGTPNGTQKYLKQWNDTVNVVLTLANALDRGICSLPTASTWPLLDDDIIDIQGGEFRVKQADELLKDRMDALINRCKRFYDKKDRLWDRMTMFSVPSTETALLLERKLNDAGLPAIRVTQDTSRHGRNVAFQRTLHCQTALVQIDVVSEGVDYPFRRIIDCRPTMSPVKWVQQIGREMRPIQSWEDPPEYICCCRNLERHAYLMEGMLPTSKIIEAQEAFNEGIDDDHSPAMRVHKVPRGRIGARAVGLEGLGKFVTSPVRLLSGLTVFTYNLVKVDQFKRTEYYIVVHPNSPEPVFAEKVSTPNPSTGELQWGKWRLIESIPDVKGCNSIACKNDYELTEKQIARWNEDAEKLGLDVHQQLTNRKLQTLFFLKNTGVRFR